MRETGIRLTLTLTVCVSAFISAQASTLGYWDFAGGTIGAEVTSAADKSGAGGCGIALVGEAVGTGGTMPTYVDAPGKYIYSRFRGGTLLSDDARGVKVSAADAAYSVGSRLSGANLGTLISQQTGGFTLEFFFKEDTFLTWRLLAGSSLGDSGILNIAGRNTETLVGIMINDSAPSSQLNAEWTKSSDWHHFAMRWNADTGKLDFYLDYANCSSAFAWNNPEKTAVNWYFGCSRAGTGCFDGRFAAIRLSSGVLKPEEFLIACSSPQSDQDSSTLLFEDFSAGTEGAALTEDPSATRGALGTVTGHRTSTSDVYPVYTNDVPGKTILSRAVGGKVLSTAPKSIYTTGRNILHARHLSTLLSRCSAFTIEFFAKAELNAQWQTMMEVQLNVNIRSAYNSSLQYFLQTDPGNKNYYGNASWTGYQQWHHVAVTWDGKTTKLYLDRALLSSNTDMDIGTGTLTDLGDVSKYIALGGPYGSGGITGEIAAFRVSSAALAPEEMLVATDGLGGAWDDGHTLFHWGFDDAAETNGADLAVGQADPLNVAQCRPIGARSGTTTWYPQFDQGAINAVRRSIYSGQKRVGVNRAAVKFNGPTVASPGWTQSQVFMKTSLSDIDLVPDTMTYEFFFRRNLAPDRLQDEAQGQLIAAHTDPAMSAGANLYDWRLTKGRGNDQMTFWFRDKAGNGSNAVLATVTDDKWHHFALVKSGDSFKVYLDGVEKITKTTGLQKTADFVYTLGGGNGIGGFNGWIDEVRLSDIAREPSDFLCMRGGIGFVMFLR